jgi:uncharacterized repeat protein (TIGR03803 family)
MRSRIVTSHLCYAALTLSFIICATTGSHAAATEKVLFSFGAFPGDDGTYPEGSLVFDAAGNLYGTTAAGGDKSYGAVYELSPSDDGWIETVLYSFCAGCAVGTSPVGNLAIDSAGNLYGTTFEGGSSECYAGGGGCGVVFELSPGSGGWTETVLYTFLGGADGAFPIAGLAFDKAGNLYGTTTYGGVGPCQFGTVSGCGVVFKLSRNSSGGWNESILHSFQGGSDGDNPSARLTLDAAGNVYGTTAGTAPNDPGTVFKLVQTSSGWEERVLYRFKGRADGNSPEADVTFDKAGSIYGTTRYGGTGKCSAYGYSGCGTVYKLEHSETGWAETVLHSFTGGNDGEDPATGVIFNAKGDLYGTTVAGPNDCGAVFRLTPASTGKWNLVDLHQFQCSLSDGGSPLGDLILDSSGNIYGTTQEGGAYTYGTAFEVTP